MMQEEYTLVRYDHGNDSTLSYLLYKGVVVGHFCEDEHRDIKVVGETRIPAGRYEIKLRAAGKIHPKYAKRFPEFHKGMLWLQDVPNFTWIYIHMGNTDDHSEGCLLTGTRPDPDYKNGGGSVQGSKSCYERVYPMMADAIGKGDSVFIIIVDSHYEEHM